MQLKMYVVDAFTTKRFSGNQAAVVPLSSWLPDALMLAIAKENNLSETAFFVPTASGSYEIRWFSPITEIDFCGHATLASAHILFQGNAELESILFSARAVGEILVRRAESGMIEMRFSNRAPVELTDVPEALAQGLSIKPIQVLKNQQAYFAVYNTEREVEAVVPNLDKLITLGPLDVVVTAPSIEFDFASRYFWPANGGVEDPVTGSIHAGLAPYWAQVLGKNNLVAIQRSARSGVLYCRVDNDTVFVSGHCANYLEGVITV